MLLWRKGVAGWLFFSFQRKILTDCGGFKIMDYVFIVYVPTTLTKLLTLDKTSTNTKRKRYERVSA